MPYSLKNFDSSKIIKDVDPNKGNGLIFVLGMPRSGTTLVESIIGTVQDTVAGGEKSFFSLQLHQIARNLNNSDVTLDGAFLMI